MAFVHEHDVIGTLQEVNRMGYEDPGPILESSEVDVLNDLGADMRVESRGRIVHQVNLLVLVEGARKAQPCLLAAREVDAAVADQRLVTLPLHEDVSLELAVLDGVDVALRVERLVVNDVLADLFVSNPWALCRVGY